MTKKQKIKNKNKKHVKGSSVAEGKSFQMETQIYTKEGGASDGKYVGKQLFCYFL